MPTPAREHLNRRADELLSLLAPCAEQTLAPRVETSLSHAHAVAVQTQNAEVAITRFDPYGEEIERYFRTAAGFVGLSEEPYARLRQLVDQFAGRAELIDLLSKKFIKNALLEWLQKRHLSETAEPFDNYLEHKAGAEVTGRRVDVPISFLAVDRPFPLGNVTFDFYTKAYWDDFEKRLRAGPRADAADKIMERKRRTYQGTVFSSLTVTAEPWKSIEIAKRETEKALMVLRFFSPTALLPRRPSYLGRDSSIEKAGHEAARSKAADAACPARENHESRRRPGVFTTFRRN